ncbi:hypothetical protein TTRE_0000970201 [Trichuris trichiura]|uniref:RVT 1 domain containing protein n=1 Tax=Trichuris trichiura TaxID=36087 RepID=A0A077ZQZ9_TRITR|nr:hypothetical protein TTRE_0000970201 [Trichuris trichiura]
MAAVQKHARDSSSRFARASAEVLRNMYVDDLLITSASEADALSVAKETASLLASGGFPLHKWISNSPAVKERLSCSSQGVLTNQVKTLGMLWLPEVDALSVAPIAVKCHMLVSKRSLLMSVAKIFAITVYGANSSRGSNIFATDINRERFETSI